jgi:hypothetical protein
MKVGDCLALFPTAETPVIMRDCVDGTYNLVGMAYVSNLLEIPWFEVDVPRLITLRIR